MSKRAQGALRPPDHLPEHVLRREDFVEACARHDLGEVLKIAKQYGGPGFTASHLARRCELTVSRVQDYVRGRTRVTSAEVIARIADGLHIPGAMLGLAARPWERPAPPMSVRWESVLGTGGDHASQGSPGDGRAETGKSAAQARTSRPAASNASTETDTGPAGRSDELQRLQREDQTAGPEKALPGVKKLIRGINGDLVTSRGTDRDALLRTAARAAEFAGFLHRDLGSEQRCLHWHDRAMEFAQQANDGPMQAYVLLRKAQAAYDRRDAARMFDLTLSAASFGANLGPGLTAEILQQRARGEAMLGAGGSEVERRLDEAATVLAAINERAPSDELGNRYGARTFELQSAICLSEAGRPRDAVARYQTMIGPHLSRRDHAYFSILSAMSLALSGEPDEAARVACAALPVAIETASRRSIREARTLARALDPWRGRRQIQQLREALNLAG